MVQLPFIREQLKCGTLIGFLIAVDNMGTDSIDGAKGEGMGKFCTKELATAAAHILGGSYSVGYSQNLAGIYLATSDQIGKACDQYGSLSASRHCQQECRSLLMEHSRALLCIQCGGISLKKALWGHKLKSLQYCKVLCYYRTFLGWLQEYDL